MSDAKDWADMDKAMLEKLQTKPPKITAKKHDGNDAGSWAIFVNGDPVITGLTRSEVDHYRRQVEREFGLIP